MDFMQPLDLWNLLVVTFAGTPEIFVGVALLTVGGLAAWFKMNKMTTLLMIISLIFIVLSFVYNPLILLTTVIISLAVFFIFKKLWTSN